MVQTQMPAMTARLLLLAALCSATPALASSPSTEAAPLVEDDDPVPIFTRSVPLVSAATIGTLGVLGLTAAAAFGATALSLAVLPTSLEHPLSDVSATLRQPPIIAAMMVGTLTLGAAGAVLVGLGGLVGMRAIDALDETPAQRARVTAKRKAAGPTRNPRADM